MKNIRYIGNKPSKEDNVAGTGTLWRGEGDVQAVPDSAAAKLLGHPGVWMLDDDHPVVDQGDKKDPQDDHPVVDQGDKKDMTEADAKPPMANLDGMDKAGLRDFAQRHFGHEFHHNTGEDKMRQAIIGLMNRG